VPTEEEIERIITLYDNGKGLSQGQIAKEFKKSKSTINDWIKKLKELGRIDPNGTNERSDTKKATEAKRTYDRERRLALNDLWFEKIEKMLLDAKDSKTLRELATPYGVAEDKRSILEPMQPDGTKSGLAEMREEIHQERKNGMETPPKDLQSS
jgi:transposase